MTGITISTTPNLIGRTTQILKKLIINWFILLTVPVWGGLAFTTFILAVAVKGDRGVREALKGNEWLFL